MIAELSLTTQQADLYKLGCFVMLHPESKHLDAGRVGQIVQCDADQMMVEFFTDDLVGCTDYSCIPMGSWGPVPEFYVEKYEPRALKFGWRVNERGIKMFRNLGWGYTDATQGKS